MKRRKAKVIKIGDICIGGEYPVAIQSMAKTKTSDVAQTVKQINSLERFGCEIIRVAVKDGQDARAVKKIKAQTRLPLVADIHFDYRLALQAIDNGADKIRLNPGNIFREKEIREVVRALKISGLPLRIGVNSGSLGGMESKRSALPDRLAESALDYIRKIERLSFYDLVISLKGSNVPDTVRAYRKIAAECDYPLHLGVTATGTPYAGALKSSIAIGSLLLEGIGDTIRISLTDQPAQEIKAAKIILESPSLREFGPRITSGPPCGRCEVDLTKVVRDLERKLSTIPDCRQAGTIPLKVAIMGCVVNGPGEAKEADLAVAFGKKEGLFFRKGKAIKKIPYSGCADYLLREIIEASVRRHT